MIKVRRFVEGDQVRIIQLSKQAFPQFPFDLKMWTWRHRGNKPNTFVAINNEGHIVGHWSFLVRNLIVGSNEVTAGFTLAAMVDSAWRRKGLFTKIAGEMIISSKNQGLSLLFGFPNDISLGLHLKLGFSLKKRYQIHSVLIKKIKTEYLPSRISLLPFDFEHAYASPRNFRKNVISLKKTPKYLKWRYDEKPESSYFKYKIVNAKKNVGFVVFKKYTVDGKKHLHMIDASYDERIDKAALVNSIMLVVKKKSKKIGADYFSTWGQKLGKVEDLIIKMHGLKIHNNKKFNLVYMPLNDKGKIFCSKKQWDIKMGDTEIF